MNEERAITALQQENKRAHERIDQLEQDVTELRRFIVELWEEIAELQAVRHKAS